MSLKSINPTKMMCLLIAVFILSLVLPSTASAAPVNNPIKVMLNDELIRFAVAPVETKAGVQVEFKTLFEKLGFKIQYDAKTKLIIGTKPGLKVELQIGRNYAVVNGVKVKLSSPPLSVNGKTLVPLRFVGEASGFEVLYDGRNRIVRIQGAKYVISTLVSFDGYAQVHGKVSPGTQWVKLKFMRADDPDNSVREEIVEPVADKVDGSVFFYFGSGLYQVEVYESAEVNSESDSYVLRKTFTVDNRSETGYTFEDVVTTDGDLTFYGLTAAEVKWVWVQIWYEDAEESRDEVFAVVDGEVEGTIQFIEGYGSYRLEILDSVMDDAYQEGYFNHSYIDITYNDPASE